MKAALNKIFESEIFMLIIGNSIGLKCFECAKQGEFRILKK